MIQAIAGADDGAENFALSGSTLLERLRVAAPRVVHCAAPAGYGKSTLARQYAQAFPMAAFVDCMDVGNTHEFASAVIDALERAEPERSSLPARQYSITSASSLEALRRILDETWTEPTETSLFVFENVEAVAKDLEIVALLLRLAYTAPARRAVFICSRVPLQMRANRHLPPHALINVPPNDLLLGDAEARECVAATGGISDADVRTIVRESRGWPILLLVLARIAREGRLDAVLADSRPVAFETLHAYLISEVLDPLAPRAKELLACIRSVPGVTREELSHCLETDASEIERLLAHVPLLESGGGGISMHPIVREALAVDAATINDYRRSAAAFNDRAGSSARAAMLYRTGGDADAAARVLSCVARADGGTMFGVEMARELAHVDVAAVRRYPGLLRLLLSTKTDISRELVDIVFEALERLGDIEPESRIAIVASALGALMIDGRFREARAVLERDCVRAALSASGNDLREILAGLAEIIDSRLGAPRSSQAALLALVPGLGEHQTLRHVNIARELSMIYRWTADREECLRWSWRALDLATASQMALMPMLALLNALANAWYWCDGSGAEFLEYGDLTVVPTYDAGALLRWYNWVFHDGDAGFEEPCHEAMVVHLLLIKASRSSRARALTLLERAERRVAGSDDIALCVMVALAQAHMGAANGLENVARLVKALEALPEHDKLLAACRAFLRQAPHELLGFLRNFPGGERPVARKPSAVVRLLRESVFVGEREVKLVGKDLGLVAYLSRSQRGSSREELQEALWPELDGVSARDALYSTLYRLRKRTGSSAWIENTGNAYRLALDVTVDVRDLEAAVSAAESAQGFDAPRLEAALEEIANRAYPRLEQYEWFVPVDFKVRDVGRRVAALLVSRAFEQHEYRNVVAIAERLLREDACDEWAQEVAIRAMIALGDVHGAARAYRQYRDVLQHELAAEPSAELQALIGKSLPQ